MAISYSRKFGQIIGDMLEAAVRPPLKDFADKHKLYLDFKGERLVRKKKKKVTWTDEYGNKHDLDYVLERNGSGDTVGAPVAFIETAWRGGTRHSKNKAQEIEAAILPVATRHKNLVPFRGAILAGQWTPPALKQLESSGFVILMFSYENVMDAFSKYGIDARVDDETPETETRKKIKAWEKLPDKSVVGKALLIACKKQVDTFIAKLELSIMRRIESIVICPLHGNSLTITTVEDAVEFLTKYEENAANAPFVKYEIIVKYNNGSKLDATFMTKAEALDFLANHT